MMEVEFSRKLNTVLLLVVMVGDSFTCATVTSRVSSSIP